MDGEKDEKHPSGRLHLDRFVSGKIESRFRPVGYSIRRVPQSKTDPMLIDFLESHAAKRPSAPALTMGPPAEDANPETLSWAELASWARAIANRLTEMTPRSRDGGVCVGHLVSNRPEDILLSLACQMAGMTEVPIDFTGGESYAHTCWSRIERAADSATVWLDPNSKRQIVSAARGESAGPLPRVDPNSDALILWTSGTTNEPKGVVLSHAALSANASAKLKAVPQHPNDIRLTLLSIAHAYARTSDLGTWLISGCRLAIAPGFAGFIEYSSLAPTLINSVPSLADRIFEQSGRIHSLRLLGCGGAAMSLESFDAWTALGVTVIQGYGLTEAGPVISSQTPEDSIVDSVGGFVDGWEHRIENQQLLVRGPHVMNRYWGDETATRQILDADGWLDTGDLASLDADSGQLHILGRIDDRIVLTNGHNIDPQAIEQAVQCVPGVQNAIVTKSPNGRNIGLVD